MQKSLLFILFLTFFFYSCQNISTYKNIVSNGKADLSFLNKDDNGVVKLNGQWHFWKDKLLTDTEVRKQLQENDFDTIKVPSNWSKLSISDSSDLISTKGTLALEVTLPYGKRDWILRLPDCNSACKLIINGEPLCNIGLVSNTKETSIPGKNTVYTQFQTTNGKALIILQISNYQLPYTGTWDSMLIGSPGTMNNYRLSHTVQEALISGAILFMGLYHLILYLLRRIDKSTLVFSILCFLMAIRNMMMNERILIPLFPDGTFWWRIEFVLEHLSAHLSLPLVYAFIKRLFPKEMPKIPLFIVLGVSMIWVTLEICTPPIIHHRFLSWFEYFIFIGGLFGVYTVICAVIKKREGAILILLGLLFFFGTAVNDVLLSNEVIETFYMTSYGLFLFTLAQCSCLASRSAKSYLMVERYVVELKILTHSLERFIPKEMLSYLKKKSIIDVKLGDFTQQKMSVFFLDIRNFTARSELMTPEENFKFINRFLAVFGPIVRSHGGFIDKYLGDGFMALFPGKPETALEAALEMRKMLKSFNTERNQNDDVKFGIGIHYGPLMLGTIGESRRMDSTVISDTVNTASRLEQLNKLHGTDILISSQVVSNLLNSDIYHCKKIGEDMVKGKALPISIYSLE